MRCSVSKIGLFAATNVVMFFALHVPMFFLYPKAREIWQQEVPTIFREIWQEKKPEQVLTWLEQMWQRIQQEKEPQQVQEGASVTLKMDSEQQEEEQVNLLQRQQEEQEKKTQTHSKQEEPLIGVGIDSANEHEEIWQGQKEMEEKEEAHPIREDPSYALRLENQQEDQNQEEQKQMWPLTGWEQEMHLLQEDPPLDTESASDHTQQEQEQMQQGQQQEAEQVHNAHLLQEEPLVEMESASEQKQKGDPDQEANEVPHSRNAPVGLPVCVGSENPELTPLAIVRFDPNYISEADIIAQFAFAAALMVYFWFSVCYRLLQQQDDIEDQEKDQERESAREKQGDEVRRMIAHLENKTKREEKTKAIRTKEFLKDELRQIIADEEEKRMREEKSKPVRNKSRRKLLVSLDTKINKRIKEWTPPSSRPIPISTHDKPVIEERDPAVGREIDSSERIGPASAELVLTCPACGADSGKTWRFCSSCGSPLKSGMESRDGAPTTQDEILQSKNSSTNKSRKSGTGRDLGSNLNSVRSKFVESKRSPAPERKLPRSNSTESAVSFKTAKETDSTESDSPRSSNCCQHSSDPTSPERDLAPQPRKQSTRSTEKNHEDKPIKEDESADYRLGKYSSVLCTGKPTQTANKSLESTISEVLSVKFRKTDSVCIGSRLWPVGHLASTYPPDWGHPNKKLIAEIAYNPDHDGWIRASRWSRPSALPNRIKRAKVYVESGQFSYDPNATKREHKTAHWHLNFAGDRLFSFGGGTQVTKEDLRAMEHPCLPSLSLAISDVKTHGVEGLSTQTSDPMAGPTPILIKGAQRICTIDSTALRHKPFSEATEAEIRIMTTPLQAPVMTNILALPAVTPAKGKYNISQIRRLFIYAYTGFRAVVLESGGQRPILHTGFWGCGKGLDGNKGLTAAIQILAAGTAGIKYIHFKPGNHSAFDRSAMWHGINAANALHGKSFDCSINILATAGYVWGEQGPAHLPYQPPPDCIWTN